MQLNIDDYNIKQRTQQKWIRAVEFPLPLLIDFLFYRWNKSFEKRLQQNIQICQQSLTSTCIIIQNVQRIYQSYPIITYICKSFPGTRPYFTVNNSPLLNSFAATYLVAVWILRSRSLAPQGHTGSRVVNGGLGRRDTRAGNGIESVPSAIRDPTNGPPGVPNRVTASHSITGRCSPSQRISSDFHSTWYLRAIFATLCRLFEAYRVIYLLEIRVACIR